MTNTPNGGNGGNDDGDGDGNMHWCDNTCVECVIYTLEVERVGVECVATISIN